MSGLAIRKGGSNRQAVRNGLREVHEARPRTTFLRHVEPDSSVAFDDLQQRIAKLQPTHADLEHLTELWHQEGNGIFFETVVATA